jgi:hypothetical protein
MSDILKGNFKTQKPVEAHTDEDLNTQFEREALKRLGGSIAFVSKKKFLYGVGRNDKDAKRDAS